MWEMVRGAVLAGMVVTVVAVGAIGDDADGDHERALHAREAGEIAPLGEVLDVVHGRYDGTVIELELEQEGGRWVYEIELVAGDGRLIALRVDAKSKEILPERAD
jgi:uncharacterized membrane protein YkoI